MIEPALTYDSYVGLGDNKSRRVERKLEVSEMQMLHLMYGLTEREKMRNGKSRAGQKNSKG